MRTRRARKKVATPTGNIDDRAGFGFSEAIRKQVPDIKKVLFTFTVKNHRGNKRLCERYYSLTKASCETVWHQAVIALRSHFESSTTTDQRSATVSRNINQVWTEGAECLLKRLRFGKNPVVFSRIAQMLNDNDFGVERYVLVH